MKNVFFYWFSLIFLAMACSEPVTEIGSAAIFPQPNLQTKGDGFFAINQATKVIVQNESQAEMAQFIFSPFQERCGWMPTVSIGEGGKGDIQLSTNQEMEEEGYVLDIQQDRISIEAKTGAGFFYALQSLQQMLPASFFSRTKGKVDRWLLPVMRIEDGPAFEWRGFMLDVSRHFFTVEQVKEVLDFMATLKLNRFHWHLTDDQGWRIEIKNTRN